MKLYIYDHCPFCVRARMIIGLRGVDYETNIHDKEHEHNPDPKRPANPDPIQ